ncbi:hypothetical protein SGM_4774 [Streptomyces griseoaurantiacus M045]|uniref:Uncharacterized protein n=1 Tax=Streptomyces griseoaurantiacus M045 TaxID=996637 RepID=F3NNR0_9ACTN|nr:hypothetical protein SGM_4774 [Streptomyces griseoaurantiacus M045]
MTFSRTATFRLTLWTTPIMTTPGVVHRKPARLPRCPHHRVP